MKKSVIGIVVAAVTVALLLLAVSAFTFTAAAIMSTETVIPTTTTDTVTTLEGIIDSAEGTDRQTQEDKARDQCSAEFRVSAERLSRLHARDLDDTQEEDETLMVRQFQYLCANSQIHWLNTSSAMLIVS